jgi:hypothetical protein
MNFLIPFSSLTFKKLKTLEMWGIWGSPHGLDQTISCMPFLLPIILQSTVENSASYASLPHQCSSGHSPRRPLTLAHVNGLIKYAHICTFCNFDSAMHVHLYHIYMVLDNLSCASWLYSDFWIWMNNKAGHQYQFTCCSCGRARQHVVVSET